MAQESGLPQVTEASECQDDPSAAMLIEQASQRPAITPTQQRLLLASEAIALSPPDQADFLHSVMCQVGLPRKRTEAKTFERQSGFVNILLEAGKLFNGRAWVDQPLPYGTTPRLVMVHVSTEAIRTQSRAVEIGHSMRQFLTMLGMPTSGGARGGYAMLKQQMNALAACRLTLGMYAEGRAVTVDAKPIKRFEAWLTPTPTKTASKWAAGRSSESLDDGEHEGTQHSLWPGVMELSQEFYDTLTHHAVPLDYRALGALKHSALALDIYTWLAHRLCRVNKAQGVMLSWQNLMDQFGQEYATSRNFKHEFRAQLRQVLSVYPGAIVDEVPGGLKLYPSRPPLAPTVVGLIVPSKGHTATLTTPNQERHPVNKADDEASCPR